MGEIKKSCDITFNVCVIICCTWIRFTKGCIQMKLWRSWNTWSTCCGSLGLTEQSWHCAEQICLLCFLILKWWNPIWAGMFMTDWLFSTLSAVLCCFTDNSNAIGSFYLPCPPVNHPVSTTWMSLFVKVNSFIDLAMWAPSFGCYIYAHAKFYFKGYFNNWCIV